MDIVARLIDNLEFELENLESLIELSKGADIEVHSPIFHLLRAFIDTMNYGIVMRSMKAGNGKAYYP